MSTKINTGWLKNVDGEKFAPKTLMSQVVTNDGVQLSDKIEAELSSMKQESDAYIDEKLKDIAVPTSLSELNDDAEHRTVTDEEKNTWNQKSDFSGKYEDLEGAPSIPSKVSELENDENYLTTETDPTVPAWAKEPTKPTYTYEEVGAEKVGTASSVVNTHNTNTEAHNDIRTLITDITTRLNALANSTDTELDQMAELVEYIKDNRELIEGITTNKVNVSDIVNNLTTNVDNKVLSAAQGVELKGLIDVLQEEVDGKLDSSDLFSHTGNTTAHITETERTNWNDAKEHASSTHAPSNAQSNVIETVKVNGTTLTPSSKAVDITVPTKLSDLTNDAGFKTTDNDTKNTAGSTDSSSKLFLIGATSQAANPQTYSHNTAYVGTDGHLYSDSKQVVNLSGSQSLTNKTYNGYTLGAACAKGVATSVTSGNSSLVTSGAVYTAINSAVGDINSVLDSINRTEV